MSNKHILLIEDEMVFARAVCKYFRNNEIDCHHAATLQDASVQIHHRQPQLILLDMRLPDGSGLEFLQNLRRLPDGNVPVIAMTAFGQLEDAVAAMKLDALDYLKKPVDLGELLQRVNNVLTAASEEAANPDSDELAPPDNNDEQLIGQSAVIEEVREQIAHFGSIISLSLSEPPTVLVLGETGCGKDLVARLLHQHGQTNSKPFVHVDCASLPRELIEAELFGHVKGAFTNAAGSRKGLFESAQDGTIFLDEIGELPLDLQAKLLAVLERRVFRKLGSSVETPTSAWVIAATNQPLETLVKEGRFRADLFYRLQVLNLRMPALREHAQDIPQIALYFRDKTLAKFSLPAVEFQAGALQKLSEYHWPGNVRELRNEIERAVLMSRGKTITADTIRLTNTSSVASALPAPRLAPINSAENHYSLADNEQDLIRQALVECEGNVSRAARKLGITRMTLRYRMQKYSINAKTENDAENGI